MPIRKARSRNDIERPRFDIEVKPNGYAWWYIDGISNDGNKAISIIGFIGSVFSPWYYWSGRKNPSNHVCINVAMYGKGWRWTMTERGEKQHCVICNMGPLGPGPPKIVFWADPGASSKHFCIHFNFQKFYNALSCLLYTSPSPRDRTRSRMPSSA